MRVLCNGGGGSCSSIGAGAIIDLIFLFIFMGVVVVSRMILDIGEGVVVGMSGKVGTTTDCRCAQRCSWNSRLMR